jgi:hypothetical protein
LAGGFTQNFWSVGVLSDSLGSISVMPYGVGVVVPNDCARMLCSGTFVRAVATTGTAMDASR